MEEKKSSMPVKKDVSKKTLIILSSVAVVFLLVAGVFANSYVKKSQTIKTADAFISMDKFDEGIAIYENILTSGAVPAIILKRDSAIELMDSKENYDKGITAFDNDNIGKAVKHLSKVPKSDVKRFKEASDKLSEIEDTASVLVEELINSGDLDGASKLVNDYLKSSPDSESMQNAKDTIATRRTESENQAKAEESKAKEAEQSKKDADAAAQKKAANSAASENKKSEARTIARNIIGTYKPILTSEANLRIAPSLNSDIILKIPRGEDVYIHDTQLESSNRIWCRVSVDYGYEGWVSYNTMNYSMP